MNLLFPTTCFHCQAQTEKRILCSECLETFQLIAAIGHCKKCSTAISLREGTCTGCREITHECQKIGACFEGYGPISSLINAYKTGYFRLIDTLASYIVLQMHALRFPDFNIITTTTCAPIAKNVAKRLRAQYKKLLKRKLYPEEKFLLKKREEVYFERVLLLELDLDQPRFQKAAYALNRGCPRYLYGMALCVT